MAIMPFGRHKNKRLADVPCDYLAWVLRECSNISPALRAEIRHILAAEIQVTDRQQELLCAPNLVSKWYCEMSRTFHPDVAGGSDVAMKAVNRGRELLLRLMEEAAA
jgi:hypothetical protein